VRAHRKRRTNSKRDGSVSASTTKANALTVHDVGVSVPTARSIAVIGLLLGVAGTLVTGAGVLRDPYARPSTSTATAT
jgi:hypothetical protein